MIIIFIIALSLFLVDYLPDNTCPFVITEPESYQYMTEKQVLGRVPARSPQFAPLPQKLKISNLLIQTNQNYEVPEQMYETMINNIEMNPQFEYRFYNGEQRREFMKSMGERYLRVYDTLIPSAYKADVFRYTAIYHYGGCYMDAGSFTIQPLTNFLLPSDQFISSYDCQGFCLNSAFFCSTKGHKILQNAINIIFNRVQAHNYGHNSIDITGPYKFMEGLKEYMRDPEFRIRPGDYGNGVRFFEREYRFPCLIAIIRREQKGEAYVMSKYPAYIPDMRRYTGRERYGDAWKKREVFRDLGGHGGQKGTTEKGV